ncbi:MAG: papain-like cysteine protease family protein [Rhodoferax sp.]
MSDFIVKNVPYIAQTTYETCWLAAYKMMLAWKKRPQELAERLPNDAIMRQNGILDSQFLACRGALGLLSSSYTGFKDADAIEGKLQSYGPIWVSGTYAKGHKHIVVLYGVRGSGNSAEVLINNPETGMSITNPKPDWWPIGWFANRLNPVSFSCQHWFD